jgi:hypothetical protein
MDTYGHLFPDSEDLGRGAIDAILGPASAAAAQSDSGNLRQVVSTNDN